MDSVESLLEDDSHLLAQRLDTEHLKKPRERSMSSSVSPVSVKDAKKSQSIPVPNAVKTTVGFGTGSVVKMSGPDSVMTSSLSSNLSLTSAASAAAAEGGPASSQAGGDKAGSKAERRDAQSKQKADKEKRKQEYEKKKAEQAPAAAAAGGEGGRAAASRTQSQSQAQPQAQAQAQADKGESKADGKDKSRKMQVKQVATKMQADDERKQRTKSKMLAKQQVPQRVSTRKQVGLFSHLLQYDRALSLTRELSISRTSVIHPSIVRLGVKISEDKVAGSTGRCLAMLDAFKDVFRDYCVPPGKELSRDLSLHIQPLISFLEQCRPLSPSMGSAIKYMKHVITHELAPVHEGMARQLPEAEAKQMLLGSIDKFVHERLELAQKQICNYACTKIEDGDVLLVYGSSVLIFNVLLAAHDMQKKFRVVIVDARPKMKGREMLKKCVAAGISCSYVLICSLNYVLREVTKVLLSAAALLANGYVMSAVGTSLVAMAARHYNVPVLVCCETYKFLERVQTDSFVFNELGDPEDLVSLGRGGVRTGKLQGWHDVDQLKLLNLVHDVTPPEFVSLVVTDLGMVPCTSVPVVLRVKEIKA